MNNSVQIAVDLLSTLLTGGFLLFFIETMHIESDVKQRFKSFMNPFYHRLSKMTVFVGYMRYSIIFPQNRLFDNLKKDLEFISKAGIVSSTSGRDIPYMNSKELESLCEAFNNIWYQFDRYPELRRDIVLEDGVGLDTAAAALCDVYPKYINKKVDIDTLQDATGAFYVDYWQPVEHCTSNYESWESKSKITRILIFCSLGTSLLSLIVIMLWVECICIAIPCIFAILSSTLFGVCVGMMARLVSLSNRLFRAA
jgi:hypothetical protein